MSDKPDKKVKSKKSKEDKDPKSKSDSKSKDEKKKDKPAKDTDKKKDKSSKASDSSAKPLKDGNRPASGKSSKSEQVNGSSQQASKKPEPKPRQLPPPIKQKADDYLADIDLPSSDEEEEYETSNRRNDEEEQEFRPQVQTYSLLDKCASLHQIMLLKGAIVLLWHEKACLQHCQHQGTSCRQLVHSRIPMMSLVAIRHALSRCISSFIALAWLQHYLHRFGLCRHFV